MRDGTSTTQGGSDRAARAEETSAAREQGVRTERSADLSSPQLTVSAEGPGVGSDRERQAADDANEAARNSQGDTDAESPGVLDERRRDPLPGDADEAVPASTPHRQEYADSGKEQERPGTTP
jgi:hypothetical protein